MRLLLSLAALALVPSVAFAQAVQAPTVTLSPDGALLNVTAEGRAERAPDLATFNAGVVTQARTAGEAMSANTTRMNSLIAALKRAGVAERDIQTSTLNLTPQMRYPQPPPPPRRLPDGTVAEAEPAEPEAPRIIGYEARNTVTAKVRRVDDLGRIVDALVAAGANQVDGPYFSIDKPEAATDQARADALRTARARAELYAREAGFSRVRIVSMTEGGGYYPITQQIVVTGAARGAMAGAPPPPPPPPAPVQPGEVGVGVSLAVQFALER